MGDSTTILPPAVIQYLGMMRLGSLPITGRSSSIVGLVPRLLATRQLKGIALYLLRGGFITRHALRPHSSCVALIQKGY